jgi:rhodanese-related sulfurtransferase
MTDNSGVMKHVLPTAAWAMLQAQPDAVLIDVRMEIESLYVGRPPGAINVPWYEYPDLTPHPEQFVKLVGAEVADKTAPVLLICRSGKRTLDAGLALEAAGYTDVYNVLHGFEGELNDQFHRSTVSGWRFDGLPWEQL